LRDTQQTHMDCIVFRCNSEKGKNLAAKCQK